MCKRSSRRGRYPRTTSHPAAGVGQRESKDAACVSSLFVLSVSCSCLHYCSRYCVVGWFVIMRRCPFVHPFRPRISSLLVFAFVIVWVGLLFNRHCSLASRVFCRLPALLLLFSSSASSLSDTSLFFLYHRSLVRPLSSRSLFHCASFCLGSGSAMRGVWVGRSWVEDVMT